MKKFLFSVLFIIFFSLFVPAGSLDAKENKANKYFCKSNYNHGYFLGYQSGQKEKGKKQDSEPRKSYTSSEFQKKMKRIEKETANFDQKCFKKGYIWGYKDGYADRPMKKMNYKW